jgi:hypothetical protein
MSATVAAHRLSHYETDEPTRMGCAVRAVCTCGWTTETQIPNEFLLDTPACRARVELDRKHTYWLGAARVPAPVPAPVPA